jgi:DOPA 4,5-dioxygenase
MNNERTVQRPRNLFGKYHAHVYFDETSMEQARALCQGAAERFGVLMGRMHQKPVGPHPRWSCQLSFDRSRFDRLIPWLDENRDGLDILVHGVTGKDLEDHSAHASWLGDPVELDLTHFA